MSVECLVRTSGFSVASASASAAPALFSLPSSGNERRGAVRHAGRRSRNVGAPATPPTNRSSPTKSPRRAAPHLTVTRVLVSRRPTPTRHASHQSPIRQLQITNHQSPMLRNENENKALIEQQGRTQHSNASYLLAHGQQNT